MKKYFRLLSLAICLAFVSCKDEVKIAEEFSSLPEEHALYCTEWKTCLENLSLAIKNYQLEKSADDFKELIKVYSELNFDADYSELNSEEQLICKKMSFSVDSARKSLEKLLDVELDNNKFSIIDKQDHLFEGEDESYNYFYKGTKLYVDIKTDGKLTFKIYNADSKNYIKTYNNQSHITDSLEIKNSAIYVMEFLPKGNVYADVNVSAKYKTLEQLTNAKDVKREMVQANANGPRVIKIDGIEMKDLFEEPRKFTLRSQGKSLFSGSSRAIIPIKIPAGTTDLLYRLRISTNEGVSSSDGEFDKNLNENYKEVKFMNITVYEKKEKKNSLLREILYGTEPAREEEAYCNVFVFTNSSQAKKFQDNVPTAQLKYDIDLSLLGTQSCNGRIPCNGMRSIYLGFENERIRFSNYLWLEIVAVSPKIEYHKYVYKIDD